MELDDLGICAMMIIASIQASTWYLLEVMK